MIDYLTARIRSVRWVYDNFDRFDSYGTLHCMVDQRTAEMLGWA